MARSIRKKIKETEKDLKKRFKKSGLSRREARRTARSTAKDVYEAETQEKLAKNEANRQASRAAREAFFQKNRENEAMLKEQSRKAEEERLKQRPPQNQRPKSSNIATDLTTVTRGGIKGKASYNEQRKLYQDRVDQNQEAKRKAIESGAETFKTINPKTGEERNSRLKPKAKNGSALAIMIAPVKTKKMKAIKKGAHGAKIKEAMYGAKMKKAEMGGKLKEVPSDNKGLGKLPKKVRNKMGYMKDGGKVEDKMMYGGAMKKAMYGAKMKKAQNGGKVTDTDPKKKKKVSKKKTINANRTDLVTDYLNSLDKNSKEYKETIAYMDRMGIPR
tara:strand:- start:26 stop:1018 length:993 start_codon:yes stop_codon:yes gene_type:complete